MMIFFFFVSFLLKKKTLVLTSQLWKLSCPHFKLLTSEDSNCNFRNVPFDLYSAFFELYFGLVWAVACNLLSVKLFFNFYLITLVYSSYLLVQTL